MTIQELKERYGLNKRWSLVKCSVCGKELKVPNMYSEKDRNEVLSPYCPTAVMLDVQWMIHHGWHISSIEATPPHKYYCPECFPKGTPEFHESPYAAEWCKQAEEWMNEETK